jgi:hypothetical protein
MTGEELVHWFHGNNAYDKTPKINLAFGVPGSARSSLLQRISLYQNEEVEVEHGCCKQ